ncbi:MAG: hypothetical protein LBH21_08895 [Gracilibacteraceae bacterium]|jgi:hypothetical protein|nr:hypothetical protein [Gracilibacteraceae bacterium]
MRKPWFLQKHRTIEAIIRYMEERYEDTFIYYSSDTESYLSSEKEIWLQAGKLPQEMVLVLRNIDTGDLVDNYLGLLLREEMEQEVRRVAVQVYGDCFLSYKAGIARPPLDLRTTDARVFLRSPGAGSNALILVQTDPERKEEDLTRFAEALRAEQFSLGFSITYIDPKVFPEITAENRETYDSPARPSMLCRGFFRFVHPELTYINWTKDHLAYPNSIWRRQAAAGGGNNG